MTHTLAIIGAGNMGSAIINAALDRDALSPTDVLVLDRDQTRLEPFARRGCATSEKVADAWQCGHILLAVKPQVFPDIADQLHPLAQPTVVISVMAGVSSEKIRHGLGDNARVVRTMPNLPAQIGAGMAGIAVGDGARPGDETLARKLLGSVGQTVIVDESLMHAVTAVSGSGPGYVFLLAEAMQQAGENLGLDETDTRTLVEQTLYGASMLLRESNKNAADLRRAVTSPGGTTEAAIRMFESHEFSELVNKALQAARDRGAQLDQI